MLFWFVFTCDCLIPIAMAIAGRMMYRRCPKQINRWFGYRTEMSMKNMDTWKFAHEHAGKLWWKVGLCLLGLTMLIHIPFYGAEAAAMGILCISVVLVQSFLLLATIPLTERALKKTFHADGTKR